MMLEHCHPVTQKTHCLSVAKTDYIMLFRVNHPSFVRQLYEMNTHCVGKKQFLSVTECDALEQGSRNFSKTQGDMKQNS